MRRLNRAQWLVVSSALANYSTGLYLAATLAQLPPGAFWYDVVMGTSALLMALRIEGRFRRTTW